MHASNSKTASKSKMVVQSKRFFWRVLPAMAMALAMVSAVPVSAQEVDGDFEGETQYIDKGGNPRDIKEPTSRERKKVTDLFAAGKAGSKEEEQAFEDLAHYYVNALTLKKNISVLPDKRKELKTKYLAPSGQKNRTVTDLHTRLNELTLTTCRNVAEDAKYPRAVRYNCVLMIGELDSEENQPGTAEPVPLPAATTALLDIARDDKQYILLRLGSMVGLKRHTTLGVAPSVQPQLAETLLGIVDTPLEDESNPDGQIWLRFNAAGVLHEALKKQIAVDQGKFAAALVARIGDERMPNWARARLAGELGKLNGRNLTPAQMPLAARSLAGMMLSICQTSPFAVDPEAEAQKDKAEDGKGTDKRAGDKKTADKENAGKKGTDKKGSETKADGKKDDKKDDKAEPPANAVAAEPPSPAVQKIISEEMMWQLSQIRVALYGKDAPTSKDKGPDAAFGLRAGATEDPAKTMIDKMVGHIDEIVRLLADVPGGKDVFSKLADTLQTTSEDLEEMLSVPAAEEEAPPAAKPVAGRPRAPAGNAPTEVSAAEK